MVIALENKCLVTLLELELRIHSLGDQLGKVLVQSSAKTLINKKQVGTHFVELKKIKRKRNE